MKFCIDDANVEKIRRIYEYYPIDGVSTNPSILAKTGRDPYEVLKEIRSIIGEDGELFVQATAGTAEGMAEEAKRIVEVLGRSTLVKIPCNPEGFKAMKQLKKEGIRFIGTAIYTAMQGFLAAKCGAEYVAPYVNRIDNMGFDGVQVAKDIHDAITANGLDSGLLAASFKNRGPGAYKVWREGGDGGAGCHRRTCKERGDRRGDRSVHQGLQRTGGRRKDDGGLLTGPPAAFPAAKNVNRSAAAILMSGVRDDCNDPRKEL